MRLRVVLALSAVIGCAALSAAAVFGLAAHPARVATASAPVESPSSAAPTATTTAPTDSANTGDVTAPEPAAGRPTATAGPTPAMPTPPAPPAPAVVSLRPLPLSTPAPTTAASPLPGAPPSPPAAPSHAPAPPPGPPATPTPPPAPSATPPGPTPPAAGSVQATIAAAAQRHGLSPAYLVAVARCESGLDPRALNPAGPYEGLFQFFPSTFAAHGGTNIWDAAQQSEIAATMFATGQGSAWRGCA